MYKIQGLANLTVGNLSAPNIGSKLYAIQKVSFVIFDPSLKF